MRKKTSYTINFGLLLCVAAAFLFGDETLWHKLLLSVGLFGLSGSLTNSLAIHMLFEKVPLIYGSGIIALNFQEIKKDLEELMIRQFFNRDQIERFLAAELQNSELGLSRLDGLIDFELLFDKFKMELDQNFQGNPLMLMALPLLEANRQKIIAAMRSAVAEELAKPELEHKVKAIFGQHLPGHAGYDAHGQFEERVRSLIRQRLEEMTPKMVKEIIQHMMESKFVWLVIWGALIGAIMGLTSALLRYYLGF